MQHRGQCQPALVLECQEWGKKDADARPDTHVNKEQVRTDMSVDIASGRVTLDYEDVAVPGKVALVWDRRYSTDLLKKPATRLGLGWTCRYYATLTHKMGKFSFITPEGVTETLADPNGLVAKGGIIRHFGAFLEIFQQNQCYIVQSWNVENGDVWRYCFKQNAAGEPSRLDSIEDVTGQRLELIWDDAGRLLSIRQRMERRELRLAYNKAGYVELVALYAPNGEHHFLARYIYDSYGRQIEARDAADFADRFEYDAHGRLSREIVKDGGVFHYRYDHKGRCVLRTGLNHYNEKRLRYIDSIRVTEVTDSRGHKSTYQHLPSGQAVLEIDPLGGRRATEYDQHGRIVAKTDATGASTRYTYDEQGNRNCVIDALGNRVVFTYNNYHQSLSMCDASGQLWCRAYNADNRLVTVVDPLGSRWVFRYDADGNIVEIVNPKGDRKCQRYDSGILQIITDWMGNPTYYTFDVFGRVVERRAALGEITYFRYDVMGNPVQVTLPDDTTLAASYDRAGNMVCYIDGNGCVTRWRYGPCMRLLERIDTVGGTIRYIWGSERGQLEQVINERGEVYRFIRDDGGRIIREISFDGGERQFQYNAEGYPTAYTNGNGETVAIERDMLHRVVGQALPDGEQVRFSFDATGNITQAVNADIEVSFERDLLGRIVREIQGDQWVESQYDAVSNLVRIATSFGHTVDYKVDANGYVSKLSTLGNKAIEFKRNAYGEEIERRMPGGASMEQCYDAVGHLIEQHVTTLGSAANGDGTGMPCETELVRRSCLYDRNGALTRITDGRWGGVDYLYDPAERLLSALRERGTSEQFEYGSTSNIIRMCAQEENVSNEKLVYGPGNRLLQKGSTRFEYDAAGRRIKMIEDANGASERVWFYEWNALDRLRVVKRPDGQVWRYCYDAIGRRRCKNGPGKTKRFLWDKDVVIHEIERSGTLSSWIFEPSTFRPLITIQNSRIYSLINDQLGTPREAIDDEGKLVWAQAISAWGDLRQNNPCSSSQIFCPLRFQGQWYDEETRLSYNRFRYYDPATGQFLSCDPLGLRGGLNLYRYTTNPINFIDPRGLCEDADKLAEARAARDELAGELGTLPSRERPATVTAGWNVETGEVAARPCGGGSCAETHVVAALGGDPTKVKFTEAVRPRAQEPPFRQVPVCVRCEGTYGRDPFPAGTTSFQSDASR